MTIISVMGARRALDETGQVLLDEYGIDPFDDDDDDLADAWKYALL